MYSHLQKLHNICRPNKTVTLIGFNLTEIRSAVFIAKGKPIDDNLFEEINNIENNSQVEDLEAFGEVILLKQEDLNETSLSNDETENNEKINHLLMKIYLC